MTTRHTGALLEAATALMALGDEKISSNDDPLTMVRDLHAALFAIREVWPSIAKAAHFDTPMGDEDPQSFEDVTAFVGDVQRGLDLVTAGLKRAADSI